MSTPRIRITGVRIHKLEAKLSRRIGWSLGWTDRRTATLVEVSTDAGLTGWGDGHFGGDTLLRSPELVIGRSPFEVEAIYEDLRPPGGPQARRGSPVCGGLDTALWDLAGQALGLPVSRLLGGPRRQAVDAYCTALYRQDWNDLAEGLAAEARAWRRLGHRVLKMKIGYGPETDVRLVRAVREAVGGDAGLAVDANCAYDAATALALGRRLEPFDLLWWEEPLLADDWEGYARLRASLRIPLAGGETLAVDELLRHYVQPRLVDILQPEIEIIGLTGARRLTPLCWLNRIRLMPHNWGTALRTAAILHWMSAVPPVTEALASPPLMFELDRTEHPFRDAVIAERLDIDAQGRLAVPDRPGLGVTVLPEAVARFRKELIAIP